jgi:hypothetical protein
MTDRIPRKDYPWWVKTSMLGVPGRGGLWVFVALSLAAAAGCVAYGFRDARFFAGALFVLAALPYWLTIRWVDRHGSWEEE